MLLDLVITLAKSHLVLVFSVEDTLIQACSLSQQPFLRAFSQFSFMTSFPIDPNLSALSQVGKPILDSIIELPLSSKIFVIIGTLP